MIKAIKNIILGTGIKKKKENDFFSLSSAEQKKILKKASITANKEQAELVRRYEKLKVHSC